MTTFDTNMLRNVAATFVVNHDLAVKDYEARKAAWIRKQRAEHTDEDKVRKLRDALTKALKNDTFPTLTALRRHVGVGSLDDLFYAGRTYGLNDAIGYPPSTTAVENANEARALLAFLDTINDTTISTNALKSVGFTRLAPIFKQAALAAAEAAKAAG